MRITEEEQENSIIASHTVWLLNRLLKGFERRDLSYLNLKHYLIKYRSCYDFNTYNTDKDLNYLRLTQHGNWNKGFINELLEEHFAFYDYVKIQYNNHLVAVGLNVPFVTSSSLNKSELKDFLNSDDYFHIFDSKKQLCASDMFLIDVNSKKPTIVYEKNPLFKEYAINSVLNVMTDLFPEQMMPENNKLEFTA